jgi:hypothetical protein
MNPRIYTKTTEDKCVDAKAYYYKNKEKILEKKRIKYALTKLQSLNDAL